MSTVPPFNTFGPEALVVPRSEVLREARHCDVEILLHSDHRQAVAGCDIHPDSSTESSAGLDVKIGSWGGQNTRVGRGRMAGAGHTMIWEGHRGVEKRHRKVGLSKNFGRSREVGLGRHLGKSRLGLGMGGC